MFTKNFYSSKDLSCCLDLKFDYVRVSMKHTWSQLYSYMEIEFLDISSCFRGDDFVEKITSGVIFLHVTGQGWKRSAFPVEWLLDM